MTRPLALSFRLLFGLGFAACVTAMGVALYLQHGLGFEPCPLCIMQRVVMISLGVVFLAGTLHAPAAGGRWGYAGAAALVAAVGVGIAGRHVWLQHLPPDQVPACGPTLQYLLEILPFKEALMTVLRGDASCANIDFLVLGLSLPGWTLVAFSGLTLYSLATPVVARRFQA